MSVEMAVWRMTDEGPVSIGFWPLDLEAKLEDPPSETACTSAAPLLRLAVSR